MRREEKWKASLTILWRRGGGRGGKKEGKGGRRGGSEKAMDQLAVSKLFAYFLHKKLVVSSH